MKGEPFDLHVGDTLSWSRKFEQNLIDSFSTLSCDSNPVHKLNIENRSIVHGIFVGSMFSAMIGTRLPGTIYLKQTLSFPHPLYSGDVATAVISVSRIFKKRKIVVLSTVARDSGGNCVCEGEAIVSIPFLSFVCSDC